MCKHKWNIINTYEFKEELSKFWGARMDSFTAQRLSKRGIISVVQCEKCTKVEHIKTVFE